MAQKSGSTFGRLVSGAIKCALLAVACIALAPVVSAMVGVVATQGVAALFSAGTWAWSGVASAGSVINVGTLMAGAFKGTAMGFGVAKVIGGAAAVGAVGNAVLGGIKDSLQSAPQHADLQQVGGPVGRSQGYGMSQGHELAPSQHTPGMGAGQYIGR